MNKDKKPLAPLPPAQWPPELDDIRRELGEPLNIHNIMAHHPALTRAWMPYRNHIVANSSLKPRQRELLILRTADNCDTAYEWEHQDQWSPADRVLLQAADECHGNSEINETTYQELCLHFDEHQQLDIIATVGMYMTLATIIKTYKLPMEEA